ncbi:MAG: GIY-YIG nuclease family protein [bacterium]
MYFVYILKNSENFLYKGITDNLERRISQHNHNQSAGTRGKGPWKLVYSEIRASRSLARIREKYLKSGAGREFLKSVIK